MNNFIRNLNNSGDNKKNILIMVAVIAVVCFITAAFILVSKNKENMIADSKANDCSANDCSANDEINEIEVTYLMTELPQAGFVNELNFLQEDLIDTKDNANNNAKDNVNKIENIENDDEIEDVENIDFQNEYDRLAIADVTNYVNVRTSPDSESEIVGYIYDGAVANVESIAGENNDWFKINSGKVTGYIKSEFFIYGDEAEEIADKYVTKYATVFCDRLNVRKEAKVESERIGYIENGEKVKIVEDQGDWLYVEYTENKTGYVSSEFVNKTEEFTYARTIEEDKAIKEAEAELLARESDNEENKKENLATYVDTSIVPKDQFGDNEELRKSIIDYALSFVGNPYVSGGNSLTTGTDCSGFTMLVYQHFGYNISRIPQGQLDGVGRKISYEEIQPGDLVYYSSKGVKATHAALYIGDGQVVHAANHRDGICVSSITWVGPVYGIKNIID